MGNGTLDIPSRQRIMADQQALHREQLANDQLQGSNESDLSQSAQNENTIVLRSQARAGAWWSRWRSPLLFASLAALLSPLSFLFNSEGPLDPTDYAERTRRVLRDTP